jgi:hypothetical protein
MIVDGTSGTVRSFLFFSIDVQPRTNRRMFIPGNGLPLPTKREKRKVARSVTCALCLHPSRFRSLCSLCCNPGRMLCLQGYLKFSVTVVPEGEPQPPAHEDDDDEEGDDADLQV